jgi:Dyp-type peroxidase family
MARVDLSKKGLSYKSNEFNTLGDKIQGNILKGNGRSHTSHVFFRFKAGNVQAAKEFISNYASSLTTAAAQLAQTNDFKVTDKEYFFKVLFLTSKGYKYLGLDASWIRSMKEAELEVFSNDPSNFDHPNNWEAAYKEEFHGMITVAYGKNSIVQTSGEKSEIGKEERAKLDKEVDVLVSQLKSVTEFIYIEKGDGIKNENDDDIEHFGYVDGISQPIFFTEDWNPDKTTVWNPLMPIDLVLIQDPLLPNTENALGSFFVYRKLEQNVQGFKKSEAELGDKFKIGELAGALLVGRFENGMPVEVSHEENEIDGLAVSGGFVGKVNDFVYQKGEITGCPFYAHIRKTNPRHATQFESLEDVKKHTMARRGIIYGDRIKHPNDKTLKIQEMPEGGVGLLFMSYQKSIAKQFEFIQRKWANNPKFENGIVETGQDLVIGQDEKGVNTKPKREFGFEKHVKLKGGEYFFAPSMEFLRTLNTASIKSNSMATLSKKSK